MTSPLSRKNCRYTALSASFFLDVSFYCAIIIKKMKTDTKYIVGHYVQYYVSRDFHKDFEHDDLESAMSSFRHLCAELPEETDVEVQRQTTEVVAMKRSSPHVEYDLERWRVFDQS